MRVGMVGPALDASGGIAAVARSWLESPELRDVDVRYYASMGDGGTLEKVGRMAAGQVRFAASVARRTWPDVWHIHLTQYTSFWRKLVYFREALFTGRPIVVHIHGSNGFERLHDDNPIARPIVEWMLRRSAAICVVSKQMAEVVKRWIGDEVPIHVLYNPVSVDEFATARKDGDRPPVVLFLGLICEAKGTFDLLATVPTVLSRVPDARFVIAGNGEVDRLRAEAERLGVADRVTIPGWIRGDDKLKALADAGVLCLPSYAEGLPVCVLEAMACGLPVVSTPIAGIPEAVRDGRTGYLVPPGDRAALADRLVRLLADDGLRRRMGERGLALARQRFDRDVVVRELKDIWSTAARERAACR